MASPTARSSVLLVEDDQDIRETIAEVLQSEGYSVFAAATGQDALGHLRAAEALPGLILLDLMMPGMDGTRFSQEQHQNSTWARIPVVVLSAGLHTSEKAAAIGAIGALRKPLDIDQLLGIVASVCDPQRPAAVEA